MKEIKTEDKHKNIESRFLGWPLYSISKDMSSE
jgi:hypothetical protein